MQMFQPPKLDGFDGAKVILFCGRDLVVIRRDHTPGIPWPGYLDWPGGGREGNEPPNACALRETREELGLTLRPDQLVWCNAYRKPGWCSWFFAAHLPASTAKDIVFGGEGMGWNLMKPSHFLDRSDSIPHFRDQLSLYLAMGPQ